MDSDKEAERLRKGINAKRLDVYKMVEKMNFPSGLRLIDAIHQRMLLGGVVKPNTVGALELYDYLILEV